MFIIADFSVPLYTPLFIHLIACSIQCILSVTGYLKKAHSMVFLFLLWSRRDNKETNNFLYYILFIMIS